MTRPLLFELRVRLRVALERYSLLEEELGATHKGVSLINHILKNHHVKQNYTVKTTRLMGKMEIWVQPSKTLLVTHNIKNRNLLKNGSSFIYVKWLRNK